MKKCNQCNSQVNPDAKFCRQCGVKLIDSRENLGEKSPKNTFDNSESNSGISSDAYSIAWYEIENKTFVTPLWSLAYAQCNGNKEQTEAKYINLRVNQLEKERRIEVERKLNGKQRIEGATLKENIEKFNQLNGLQVTAVEQKSQAYLLGIQIDDVITEYNYSPIRTGKDLLNLIKEAESESNLTVYRKNGNVYNLTVSANKPLGISFFEV